MSVSKRTSEIVTAATTVAAVLNARNYCDAGLIQDARAVFEKVRAQYLREVALATVKTITDGAQANIGAYFTAASIVDLQVYTVTSNGDTTDNAHEAAKGSAVAAGDVFQRASGAVQYVGILTDVAGMTAALAEVAG